MGRRRRTKNQDTTGHRLRASKFTGPELPAPIDKEIRVAFSNSLLFSNKDLLVWRFMVIRTFFSLLALFPISIVPIFNTKFNS